MSVNPEIYFVKELRCMLVGIGGVGKVILRHLIGQPWFRPVAFVDVDPLALTDGRALIAPHVPGEFPDLGEALKCIDADAVLINTPSELHYQQSLIAIDAGLHVCVAKPVTNDFAQAQDLVCRADAAGVTLSVKQQMRHNRHYQTVASFLRGGEIGQPEIIAFSNSKPRHKAYNLATMSQPALFEMSCHHFDTLMAMFPDHAPLRISCDGFRPSWSVYGGPCMVNALIELEGGVHVLYHGGFSSQSNWYELRVEGSLGVLRCRGLHMSKDTMEYEIAPRGGEFEVRDLDKGCEPVDAFVKFLDLWAAYVDGGPEPPWSGRNNLKVFGLLSAAIDSIEQGGTPVRVARDGPYAEAYRTPGEWSVG